MDVDGNLKRIKIVSMNFNGASKLTFENVTVTPGAEFALLEVTNEGSWTFDYLYNNQAANMDWFIYQVIDTTQLESRDYTVNITTIATPYIPIAVGEEYVVLEDQVVAITFKWGDVTTSDRKYNYWDSHYLQSNVQIVIISLPIEGNLYQPGNSTQTPIDAQLTGTNLTWNTFRTFPYECII
eukprot:TRINITY_DN4137_c1_g1_i1.p1 TRINITY_DN4137_c1_g1~~TRINITY_DN4137_c1_g1_i1.p1  ORF type:complete len:207 (+),score=40.89 TRINITY_DN4137_c1_g1_i1:78-623(+)